MTSAAEKGAAKTKRTWFGRVSGLLGASSITTEAWDELEEALIGADVGLDLSEDLITKTRDRVSKIRGATPEDVRRTLIEELAGVASDASDKNHADDTPDKPPGAMEIIMVVGVNGSGKTTSIAKLARRKVRENRRVLLVAADTFRAAATEQLQEWGKRLELPVIAQQYGADAGAIVFDGVAAAQARGIDTLIIDTAGRLQTRTPLMDELRKVRRVIERSQNDGDVITVLLALDATTGQNGLSQAREFLDAVGVDAVILTKVDGTSKGGVALAVRRGIGVPIKYVGIGEGIDDLEPFDADAFVRALLE